MPRSLLLTQAVYRHGANLDPETQITIGAQNGLRGYAVNQWVGTRSLLAGQRGPPLRGRTRSCSSSPSRWPRSRTRATPGPRRPVACATSAPTWAWVSWSAATVSPAALLRIDLAYAFNPPPGRSRWQVSTGVQLSFVD